MGVLWGVLWAVPEVQAQQLLLGRLHLPGVGKLPLALGVSSMVIAWSISEVIRYSFYFCKARKGCPSHRRPSRARAVSARA